MVKYIEELNKTLAIAEDFVRRAEVVKAQHSAEGREGYERRGVNRAALRRTSMELTRQLAQFRRA